MFRRKEILVLGDSHAFVFKSKYMRLFMPRHSFKAFPVKGATISGIDNPNSKTKAGKNFLEILSANRKIKTVVFLLGEVDTGFVIWYRAQKYNSSIDEMLKIALENYQKLITGPELADKRVIVISVPLPTIQDNNTWGEIANLRSEIKATIQERTQLTVKFNKALEDMVKKSNHQFISLDKSSLRSNDQGARKFLLNTNKNNHHYNNFFYSLLLSFHLRRVLK